MKPLENAVIEIEEVEYLINKNAAAEIGRGEKMIILRRLVDLEYHHVSLRVVKRALKKPGIVDYLEPPKME